MASEPQSTGAICESDTQQATVLWSSISGIFKRLCQSAGLLAEIQLICEKTRREVESRLLSERSDRAFALKEWIAHTQQIPSRHHVRHYMDLSIAIAFLRDSGHSGVALAPAEIESIWALVRGVLLESSIITTAKCSSQGFFAIPLWYASKDQEHIDELIRLHVWLPNGSRGNQDTAIHSHQPFAQSWILCGQGRDVQYAASDVKSADGLLEPEESTKATHAKYKMLWSDSNGSKFDGNYNVDHKFSKVVNTKQLIRVTEKLSAVHTAYATYSVDAGVFHRSIVQPDEVHATFFFFDAERGFEQDAPVLGPVDSLEYIEKRDPGGLTPAKLVKHVESFQSWEQAYQRGLAHTRKAELEEALLDFSLALSICDDRPNFPRGSCYRYMALAELGYVYRMLGRYEKASQYLQEIIVNMPQGEIRLRASGELAVVYRHLGRLEDARQACEEQYEVAKELGLKSEICRAIGNLGMVNYQLYLLNRKEKYLATAIRQLEERVERCREIRKTAAGDMGSLLTAARDQTALARQVIGLHRLSLCYTIAGNIDKAMDAAMDSQFLSRETGDPSKFAFSRFFLGRVLHLKGQIKEALAEFNPSDTSSPVAALAKEPSEEHRGYIHEMIDAGANPTLRDGHGYSALDYAVYSNDLVLQDTLSGALKQGLGLEEYKQQYKDSVLRKGYRQILQDQMRPVLLQLDNATKIQQLRRVYAGALAEDEEKSRHFDSLKYVRYADFIRHGRLPKSDAGLTRQVSDEANTKAFIIFISYTWAKKNLATDRSPDDSANTKYHQIIKAVDSFLVKNPEVDQRTVGIWLDWACIDQVDQSVKERGVASLPMCITQCNAMISMLAETYYERAWCCVEVITIQALRSSYNAHRWFEYKDGLGEVRDGEDGQVLDVARAKVTLESDRPKLSFLERQARLLITPSS